MITSMAENARLLLRFIRLKRRNWIIFLTTLMIPRSTWATLGQIFSALSIYAILHNTFKFGLSSTMAIIVDVYIRSIDLTIGNLDPLFERIIIFVNNYFIINLIFYQEWRYIFIVLQILFVRDAFTALTDGRSYLGFTRLIFGTLISIGCSASAFNAMHSSRFIASFLFFLHPISGLLLYDLLMYGFSSTLFFNQIGEGEGRSDQSRWEFFKTGVKRSFDRLLIVLIPSTASLFLPPVRSLEFPANGITALFIGMMANTAYWLIYGARYALTEVSKGRQFRKAFTSSEAGRFGLAVASVFFWFVAFCLVNAGSRLVEL